jgi:hypothetical protein
MICTFFNIYACCNQNYWKVRLIEHAADCWKPITPLATVCLNSTEIIFLLVHYVLTKRPNQSSIERKFAQPGHPVQNVKANGGF